MNKYHEILGVSENASLAEIKKAYKNKAFIHHPDKNPGDKKANERMQKINEAYDRVMTDKFASQIDGVNNLSGKWCSAEFRLNVEKEIRNFMEKNKFSYCEDELGAKYWALFECHRSCLEGKKIWHIHIFGCLNTKEEVENFRDRFISLINEYLEEAETIKKQTIEEIEKLLTKAAPELKKAIEDVFCKRGYGDYGDRYNNWKDYFNNPYKNTKDFLLKMRENEIDFINKTLENNKIEKTVLTFRNLKSKQNSGGKFTTEEQAQLTELTRTNNNNSPGNNGNSEDQDNGNSEDQDNGNPSNNSSNNTTPLIIGGIVILFGIAVAIILYRLYQKRKVQR